MFCWQASSLRPWLPLLFSDLGTFSPSIRLPFPHSSPSLPTTCHFRANCLWTHGSLMRSPPQPTSTHCKPRFLLAHRVPGRLSSQADKLSNAHPKAPLQFHPYMSPFPRTAVTVTTNLVAYYNNRNPFFQFWRPEVQKSRCCRATYPLEALGENPFLAPSSFWWLLAFLGL